MQINFKGLYKIPGSWENAQGRGETMHDISIRKMQSFLEDTKKYMEPNASTYTNRENNDFYLPVQPKFERNFEDIADNYNIDCYKVAGNNPKTEYGQQAMNLLV